MGEPKQQKMETHYDSHTITKQLAKNDYYVIPLVGAGDNGHKLVVDFSVDGIVKNATWGLSSGGWTNQTTLNWIGNTVHWVGWSNAGTDATMVFTVTYDTPKEVCVEHCDYEKQYEAWERAQERECPALE